jgi:replicative DNA helicase
MSLAEDTLYSHLTSPDSLDVIADFGLGNPDRRVIIPTETGRELVGWALDQYFACGRTVAPSKAAILATWGDRLEAVDITIDDDTETDSVQWAIDTLREEYARWRFETWVKQAAQEVATADPGKRVDTLMTVNHELYLISQALISRRAEAELGAGLESALSRYDKAVAVGERVVGLTYGLKEIDEYYGGLRPAELAILAAYSGVGKSWLAAKILLAEFQRGRRCVLFTLENDLSMTFDRLACMAAAVSYSDWNNLTVPEQDRERVQRWIEKIKGSDRQPMVISPQPGEADPVSMVRKARLLGADSLVVDQLSHVEPMPGGWKGAKRNEVVAGIVRGFTQEIKGEYDALPCVVLHQISREGKKEADKTGVNESTGMAESSEVERSATYVHTVHQTPSAKIINRAEWQTPKARRGQTGKRWELNFRLERGDIRVAREVTDV